MTRRRSILVILLVLVVAIAAAAAYWFIYRDEDLDGLLGGGAAGEAILPAGPSAADITVQAHMPPDFDDGVPDREFKGEGTIDWESDIALVDFDMSEVPNSAGYFGHVEGDLTVLYRESGYSATFPVLADVLEGELEWLAFELGDLSDERVVGLGIGQWREVGLSDPRLGAGLLAASPAPAEGETTTTVDLQAVGPEVSPELQPAVDELLGLGVDTVEMASELDAEGTLSSYSYELSYAPVPESKKVRLTVSVELSPGGEAIEEPDEESVQPFMEFLGFN